MRCHCRAASGVSLCIRPTRFCPDLDELVSFVESGQAASRPIVVGNTELFMEFA